MNIKFFAFGVLLLLWGCGDKFGTCEGYYKSGELKYKVPCNETKRIFDGLYKEYTKEGELRLTKNYIDGKVQDTVRYYFPATGDLQKIVPFINDDPHGQAIEYYLSGKLKETQDFVNGKKHGFFRYYTPDSVLYLEVYYEKGNREKATRRFRKSDGKLVEVISYRQGTRSGPYVKYDEKGRILLKGQYEQALPVGEWTFRMKSFDKLRTEDIAMIRHAFESEVQGLDDYFSKHL
jgi:antitoxin component YwqK of YwqJK toxin-antitoxin module